MTNQSLVLQAVEAARPQFSTIVAENQSGLDTDLELEYVAYILESFGESITSNMDANSVYWSILNQATIGLSVEEAKSRDLFISSRLCVQFLRIGIHADIPWAYSFSVRVG